MISGQNLIKWLLINKYSSDNLFTHRDAKVNEIIKDLDLTRVELLGSKKFLGVSKNLEFLFRKILIL